MGEILVTGGVSILTATISSWVAWILARRKYNSEVDNTIIQNLQDALDFYKEISDDNRRRLTEVLERNAQLESEISKLKSQMMNLMANICLDLQCKNRILNEELKLKVNSKKKKDETKSGENIQGS